MTDVVTIWNKALSSAGSDGLISAEDEQSREANLCRLWYSGVRDRVLKSAPWPSAIKSERLALLASRSTSELWTSSDPRPGWRYAYALPADLIAPRNLQSFLPFDQAPYGPERAIHTNDAEAILNYIFAANDVTTWDAGLEMAVVYSMGAVIARALVAKQSVIAELRDQAMEAIETARADNANESEETYAAVPPWLNARGYSGFTQVVPSRFYWPMDSLSGVLP